MRMIGPLGEGRYGLPKEFDCEKGQSIDDWLRLNGYPKSEIQNGETECLAGSGQKRRGQIVPRAMYEELPAAKVTVRGLRSHAARLNLSLSRQFTPPTSGFAWESPK